VDAKPVQIICSEFIHDADFVDFYVVFSMKGR
jgi:hypothetical protein